METVMSSKDKIKASIKNIAGKIQEGVGDITGDGKTKLNT
jgi:uncharacterized protein YjbJ (UPF0337 family)